MKKKILVVLLLITLSLPLFAGDHFDISLGFGHYTNFKKANSLSLYYGSTIGLTDRLELVVGGVSEVTPNVFSDNELQLGLAFAIMGQRSTATKVAGSSINTLVGAGFEVFYIAFRQQENEIENAVNSWSIIQIPMKAKLITDLAVSAQEELNKLSSNAKLPVITYDSSLRCYTLGDNQTRHFEIEGSVDSFQFKKALKDASGLSVTAVFVVLVAN